MRAVTTFAVAFVLGALAIAGCGKDESPVQTAVESTKDALNMREHEQLKDAGEDAADALESAVEAIEGEVGGQ